MSHYTATAGYVPGWAAQDLQWHTLRFAAHGHSVDVAVPQLTPAQLLEVAQRVQTASRDTLKTMRVSHIIAVVDSVIARLLDANDPYRQEAQRLLPIITGFDAEMVRLGLTQYLKTFRAPQLQRFVAEDFANPKLLDSMYSVEQIVAKGSGVPCMILVVKRHGVSGSRVAVIRV